MVDLRAKKIEINQVKNDSWKQRRCGSANNVLLPLVLEQIARRPTTLASLWRPSWLRLELPSFLSGMPRGPFPAPIPIKLGTYEVKEGSI